MIEKLIYEKLYSFLHQNGCLFTYQFGFRNHHSTNHALISITEKLGKNLMKVSLVVVLFWDFQKAFDTVNHEILLANKILLDLLARLHTIYRSK